MINEGQFDIINPTTPDMIKLNATPTYWRTNVRDAVIAHVKDWTGRTPNDVQMHDSTVTGALRLGGDVFRFSIN